MAMLIFAIPLIAYVLYVLEVSRTLGAIDPDLRIQGPGMAWLLLVPVFNVIWFFFLINAIRDGFEKMASRGRLKKDVDTGYKVGIAMGCCWAASLIPRLIFLSIIPLFVFSVLHWNALNKARKQVLSLSD